MEKESDDYDPYEHRDVLKPIGNTAALINLLNSVIGTGILAIPLAYSQVGWGTASIFTLFMGLLLVYAMNILLHGMYVICKWNHVPYMLLPDALTFALKAGPPCLHWLSAPAAFLVDFVIAFNHFGVCCVYTIFIADNLKQLIDFHLTKIDIRIYIALLFGPLLCIMFLRHLKTLVPLSFTADLLIGSGLFVIFYYVLQNLPTLSKRTVWGDYKNYPIFMGTLLFAITSFGVMLVVEANMKTPGAYLGFTGILCKGQFIIVIIYIITGFLGYWRFGEETLGSITLSIPQDEILAQSVKGLYALAIFFTVPLHAYVPVDIICNHYLFKNIRKEKHFLAEYIVRICLTILMVLIAVAVPFLSLLLALVGGLFDSILAIVFPALIDLAVHYQLGYGKLKIYLIRSIFLIVFGLSASVIATIVVIKDIIDQLQK